MGRVIELEDGLNFVDTGEVGTLEGRIEGVSD